MRGAGGLELVHAGQADKQPNTGQLHFKTTAAAHDIQACAAQLNSE